MTGRGELVLKGNLSDEKFSRLYSLIQRGSCESLKYLCNGVVLENFQTLMVAWILIIRTFICTLDTGLGKTYIASAVIKWLHNAKETKNFLYVVENAGMAQTAKKVSDLTGLRVKTCNASELDANILSVTSTDDFDVLMISYQAIQSYGVACYLLENIDDFQTVIYDECQWLSELNNSNTWEISKQMRKYFRDVIMFSATPFKTNPLQLLKQVEFLNPTVIGNINAYISDKCTRSLMYEITDWYGLDRIKSDLTLWVNGFTREELGIGIKYKPFAHVCDSTDFQKEVTAHEMHRIKSDDKSEALEKLKEIVSDAAFDGEQGIIYCSTNENKLLLKKELESAGLIVEIIDGSLSDKKQRAKVQNDYHDGLINVLIINITTTLDLPSQYCVFYELCDAGTITQFIGRCVRGFADSDLTVHFILTKDTYEIDYFYNSIWKKSKYLQECLNKDGTLMKEIRKQIDKEMM